MPQIIDRGRGPEIEGTRITVYDILDYHGQGWHHTLIAATLRLSSAQVLAAINYIEAHKEEVMADYQQMLDRCARGNPPELQAKLDAILNVTFGPDLTNFVRQGNTRGLFENRAVVSLLTG